MELVRLRDRQRQRLRRSLVRSDAAFGAPLLADALPSDAPAWATPHRRTWGRDTQVAVPPPSYSIYQPPTQMGVIQGDGPDEPESNYLKDDSQALFLQGPSPPSFRRTLSHQTPARTTRFHERSLHHENPAVDMGGLCSYGFCCCQCVRTQEVGITENFGRFDALLEPGLHCMAWPCSDISGRLSLRIRQLDVVCETKTKDDVFVHVTVTVQYRVVLERAYDAYYRLTDPTIQIRSYVFDVVRSALPKLTVDEAYASKTHVAIAVSRQLQDMMNDYGYEIVDTLVTDLSPDAQVKASMNEIETNRRLKAAMPHRAEAEKTKVVKQAEAAAESIYLSGVGTARERAAMSEGLKEIMEEWSSDKRVTTKDVMDLLLITQYLDMLVTAVGSNSALVRSGPGEILAIKQSLPTTNNIPDLLS